MPRFPILSCLLLAVPVALCAQAERYTLDEGPVAVYNLAGNLRVEPGDAGLVVQVTRAGQDAGQLKIAQGEIDGRSTLRVLYPGDRVRYGTGRGQGTTTLRVRDDGTFGDLDDEHDHDRHAHHWEEGRRVTISDAQGDLSIDTGSGAVEVSRFRGPALSIDTGSGDVTGTELESEEVAIDTGSGEIRLTGVSSPRLSLETGSGGVTADLRRDIASLQAETGSGDIAIRAPASLGAELDIQTSSGDIETDFPLQVTRHGRDHVVGTIGDGKGTIAIETGSGAIRLLKSSN